jgi:Tfp pilus assembly protein PilF
MWRIYLEWGVLDQVDRSRPLALAAEKDDWLIGLTGAMVAERRGQMSAATAGYQAVLRVDPGNVDARVGLARLAQASGDAATARLQCDAVLAVLPAHAPALSVLASLAEARGDVAGAATLLARVVAASPGDRSARLELAGLLRRQGDVAGARDQWKAAVAIRADAESLVALAEAARRSDDPATERRSLERLATLDPGGPEWRRVAAVRLQANDQVGAERALRQAIARDPRDPLNRAALGRLLAATGRPTEGLEQLRAGGEGAAADREALEKRINLRKQAAPTLAALERAVGGLIDATYRQRLQAQPGLSGKLTIRVTTDASGRAALVEVLEDTLHDDDVRACAYWNLKDAAYPAPLTARCGPGWRSCSARGAGRCAAAASA